MGKILTNKVAVKSMKKKSEKHKKGILFLNNIFPSTNVPFLLRFLKKFGKIKRSFFFYTSMSVCEKNQRVVSCIIEFTKKSNAKRVSVLIGQNRHLFNQNLPVKECFYLKNTCWNNISDFFNQSFS